MKILMLSPRTPCEKGKADSMTVYYLIQYLHKKGHQIYLITFAPQTEYEGDNLKELNTYCETVEMIPLNHLAAKWRVASRILNPRPMQVNYYSSQKMRRRVKQVLADFKPDCVYAHLIRTAEFIKNKNLPVFLCMQNSQTLNYGRLVQNDKNIFRKIMYLIEYHKVKKYEPLIASQFQKTSLISKYDKQSIDPGNRMKNISLYASGIDFDYYSRPFMVEKKPYSMVMNGDFGTPTNICAAIYFLNEIYPLIKAKIPECTVIFVGRDSDKNLKKYAGKDILLTGRVEDIRPYLHAAEIAINPVTVAAGQQNKTLVSMAARLPVVSTIIANEGIQAINKKQILIATNPQQFADKTIELFLNDNLRAQIAVGGYYFVKNQWNLETRYAKIEAGLLSIVHKIPEYEVPFQLI